jgi:hypothetical protein
MGNLGKTIFQRRMEQSQIDDQRNRERLVEDRQYDLRVNQLALSQMNAAQQAERSDFWQKLQMAQLMGKAAYADPTYKPVAQDPALQEGIDLGFGLGGFEFDKINALTEREAMRQRSINGREDANRTSRDFNANVTHGDRVMVEGGRNYRQEDQQDFLDGQGNKRDKNRIDVANIMQRGWVPARQRMVETARDDFKKEPASKDVHVAEAYRKQAMAAPMDSSGDASIIYSYIKLVDPGSAVMQGEKADLRNAASIPENIRFAYNKAIDGAGLPPGERVKYQNEVNRLADVRRADYDRVLKRYEGWLISQGLDPRGLVGDIYETSGEGGTEGGSAFEE